MKVQKWLKDWLGFFLLCLPFVAVYLFFAPDKTSRQIIVDKARADARAEIAYKRKQKRYWIDQIEEGTASFSEAACFTEKRGNWDELDRKCYNQRY